MPRKKNGDFDQNKYVGQYISENYKWVNIGFNQKVPEDVEIYTFLMGLKDRGIAKAPFIKKLVRQAMEKEEIK